MSKHLPNAQAKEQGSELPKFLPEGAPQCYGS